MVRRQGGRAIKLVPHNDGFVLQFRRPIVPSDVKEGRLLPGSYSGHEKSKRLTEVTLTEEAIEDLHIIFKKWYEDREKQRRSMILTFAVFRMFQNTQGFKQMFGRR